VYNIIYPNFLHVSKFNILLGFVTLHNTPFLYCYVFVLHPSEYPHHSSHPESNCSLNRLLLDHFFNNEAISLSSPPQSSFLARKAHPFFTVSLSVILVYSHLLLHCSDHSFSSRPVLYLSNSTIATFSGTAVGRPSIVLRHVTKYSIRSSRLFIHSERSLHMNA
jgi:hypothetical protein